MSDNKSNSRRMVLLGLGGGVVGATQLPKTWSKPVIDSIMLPAHAQTTASGFGGGGDEFVSNMPTRQNILSDLISTAVAGLVDEVVFEYFPEQLYVTETAEGAFEAFVLFVYEGGDQGSQPRMQESGVYKAVGQINGSSAELIFLEGCDTLGDDESRIEIAQVDTTASFRLEINDFTILKGDLNPSSDIPSSNCTKNTS